MLVFAKLENQKQMLGLRFYPLIHPEHAPGFGWKDNWYVIEDLLCMLEYLESLRNKVEEANAVFKTHQAQTLVKKTQF
ncbi:Polyadenylate-binding protein/Hyperplastic disc protein [Cinara cedri]|uniref:Polyadenylate-binding protein/Hyperplastic disc protein n=1 Tax=Cinara cedri TaxID=506608 RepID=A0A5E4MFF8_9HEMI|nr:Polyadenylate-binding protein/Hyperplastic disc protein [Cinara cedri]